jgi:RNA polymerase sigma-54 factor
VLGMRQELRLQQRLAPQLIQSLHLLQLPALDLEQVVRQELETNPLLEEETTMEQTQEEKEPDRDSDSDGDSDGESGGESDSTDADMEAGESDTNDNLDAEEWNSYLNDSFEYAGIRPERDESAEQYERVPIYHETLGDDLEDQLRLIVDGPVEIEIGQYIIGNLDDDGFLGASIEEMAESLGQPRERVEAVLAKVQTLDPPGIGARDLREALLIQLHEKGLVDDPAYLMVAKCFDELMHRRTKEIVRRLKLTKEQISDALELIAKLSPKPASPAYGETERTIIPDLMIEKVDDVYVVALNDRSIPQLRVSPNYRSLLSESGSGEAKKYVVDRLNSAKWLIKSIEQRRTTMLKVTNSIVNHQLEFFERGIAHLKPMVLQEVADEIGMHVSTVSRVSNGKYVQTPQGIYELKFFFDGRLGGEAGEDMASKAVKDKIRRMIDDEDKKKSLSDQAIADRLTNEGGIQIARRTVAKYRDQLRISPARLRKEL